MIRQLIYKIGANPKRSARIFFVGLLINAIAAAFIALGYYHQHWYQMIGLGIAVPGVLVMAYGYLGILANRFAQVIKPRKRRNWQEY